jgi:Peptidase family M23
VHSARAVPGQITSPRNIFGPEKPSRPSLRGRFLSIPILLVPVCPLFTSHYDSRWISGRACRHVAPCRLLRYFFDPKVKALGITANSNNFASDFIYLDAQGREYHDDPRKLDNWYGYGQPIYAPGAGVVLATANDILENWFEDTKATKIGYPKLPPGKDPKDIGNFVLLDHQNGEYSLLVHMKAGSVTVRPGDRVRQGQVLGRIGFAGDSIFPHLHYSLMDGPEVFKAWGLPAYFLHFRRVLGTGSTSVKQGPVNSGDFLESEVVYSDPQ